MKKLLYLLLLITSISLGQTTLANKLKIMGNVTSTTATKVNVQESDGTINTIAKTDLVDNIFVATVGDLPTTGVDGKIYVVKNVNKSYRWTGTFYQELSSTDLTGAVLTTGNQTISGIKTFSDGLSGQLTGSIIGYTTQALTQNSYTNSDLPLTYSDTYSGVPTTLHGASNLTLNPSTGLIKAVGNIQASSFVGSGASLTGITESQVTNLVTDLDLKAPLASPTFTGTPLAPTATLGTNTTQLATTAFVATGLGTKQDALVSSTNIKSINGNTILGSGDLSVIGEKAINTYYPSWTFTTGNTWKSWSRNTSNLFSSDANTSLGTGSLSLSSFVDVDFIPVYNVSTLSNLNIAIRDELSVDTYQIYIASFDLPNGAFGRGIESNFQVLLNTTFSTTLGISSSEMFSFPMTNTLSSNSGLFIAYRCTSGSSRSWQGVGLKFTFK